MPAPRIAATHPQFAIDGENAPELATDLVSLEIACDRDGLTRLEGTFGNWGTRADGETGFRHFGGPLRLGKALRVSVGPDDDEVTVFRGTVTAVSARYAEGRSPEISVRSDDALFPLRMGRRSKVYADSTDVAAAEDVIRGVGLSPEVSGNGPSHRQLWQIHQSDLAFLRERAHSIGASIQTHDRTVRVARPDDSVTPIPLSRLRELLRFEVSADLAHQRTEVRVHGWSVSDKDGVHGIATSDDISGEADGGRLGAACLDELAVDAVQHEYLEVPATAEEARELALVLLRRRARSFLTGVGTTNGTPRMQVDSLVRIEDVGPWFEGTYRVIAYRHTYDLHSGLRTHFTAHRPSIGESR